MEALACRIDKFINNFVVILVPRASSTSSGTLVSFLLMAIIPLFKLTPLGSSMIRTLPTHDEPWSVIS